MQAGGAGPPRIGFAIVLTLGSVAAAPLARADAGEGPAVQSSESAPTEPSGGPRHFGAQRTFGLGPALGLNASGAMVEAGLAPVGLWVSGGYAPILVAGNMHDATRSLTIDGYHSVQVNADVTILPLSPSKRLDAGFIVGYRYNTVMSHGFGLGVALTYDLSPALVGFVSVEYGIFPDASSRLSNAGYPNDRDASVPWLQGGLELGLMIFP